MPLGRVEDSGCFDSHSENILFVSDPNLGRDRGWRLFSRFFPSAKKLIWTKKEKDKIGAVRRDLRSRVWLFTISFYNDFIFCIDDFDFLGLTLNLHPALPSLRGVGHDYVPLIEDHAEHGGTLHYLERPAGSTISIVDEVDTGRIIRVRRRELSRNATYGDIRAANQDIMLDMLAELCEQMSEWGCVEKTHQQLCRESVANGHAWSDRYINDRALSSLLEEVRQSQPSHRALNQSRLTY